MNTDLIVTIEVLVKVLSDINRNFIQTRVLVEFSVAVDRQRFLRWLSSETEENLGGLFARLGESSINSKMDKVVILTLTDSFDWFGIFNLSIKLWRERRLLDNWVLDWRELDFVWESYWWSTHGVTIYWENQLVTTNSLFGIDNPCCNWITELNLTSHIF
jgi:hypothetical protein